MKHITDIKSSHNKIQYWFWNQDIIKNKKYLSDLDRLKTNSNFDTVILTSRDCFDFWDKSNKVYFDECVEYAHKIGFEIILQLWPRGYFNPAEVSLCDSAALVSENEGKVQDGKIVLEFFTDNKRWPEIAPPLKSVLLRACAFIKTGDGFYKPGSLRDITDGARIIGESADRLKIAFEDDELNGYTVYAITAHYYRFADMFSDWFMNDYADLMDYYKDTHFDGFVVDEFKNIVVLPEWNTDIFRDRIYGKHFDRYFFKQTGEKLVDTMFAMRYCESGRCDMRIRAINSYFDVYRESTRRNEIFIADYAKKICGDSAFTGLHNTYHNKLQSDEIWMTGCNWWEVPRKYAQTDEDITYPVRMGIACQCTEKLIYDMYYGTNEELFFEKALRDAKYGSRVHYHAVNGGHYGVDTGNKEFLQKVLKVEEKVELLNMFEPGGLPKMEMLVVFGFPSLCNWYPDISARNCFDINGSCNILERVENMWKEGYFNALAPSDAVDDGRIGMTNDGKYQYCGHTFDKLLYLYPQYAKERTISKLEEFVEKNSDNIAVIGELTADFNGKRTNSRLINSVTVRENADITEVLKLTRNSIENGCVLEDGSVVISEWNSLKNSNPKKISLDIGGNIFESEYIGTFALKADAGGKIEKFVCGDFRYIRRNGKTVYETNESKDIFIMEE